MKDRKRTRPTPIVGLWQYRMKASLFPKRGLNSTPKTLFKKGFVAP